MGVAVFIYINYFMLRVQKQEKNEKKSFSRVFQKKKKWEINDDSSFSGNNLCLCVFIDEIYSDARVEQGRGDRRFFVNFNRRGGSK